MVIHQFNRLIKNKWVWGVFAVAISGFFAFDFLLVGKGSDRSESSSAIGKIGDKDVSADLFRSLVSEVRGYGQMRERNLSNVEVNRRVWQTIAALETARQVGFDASDEDVRNAILRDKAFQQNGQFDPDMYAMRLRSLNINSGIWEQRVRRGIMLDKLYRVVLGSAVWVSPMELDNEINDLTDKFTVRVAAFTDKDADKVKLDDKGLEAYYNSHTNKYALPDCVSVKFAKFPADAPERLAKFKIPALDVSNHWDDVSNEARFQVKKGSGTNTVTETMSLAQAWPVLERELQLEASIEDYRTNLVNRVLDPDVLTNGVDMLKKIADAEKVKVETSKQFALDGRTYVKGFMENPRSILPDCDKFLEEVDGLDPETPEFRYKILEGTNCVYMIELAGSTKAHVPAFADAKEIIREDALADARKTAFKAAVEKTRALAAAELAKGAAFDAKLFAGATVSTQIVFSASSMSYNAFADAGDVARSAIRLNKGQLSDFIETYNPKRALVVYVANREPGEAAQAQMVRPQLRDQLGGSSAMSVPLAWQDWNLNRIGFTTTRNTSVEDDDASDDSED